MPGANEVTLHQQQQKINFRFFFFVLCRCLEALGEWGQLHDVFENKFTLLTEDNKQKACRLGLASSFGLHNYESMERSVMVAIN